ncbi:hypothetical protein ACIBH1_45715 [Nonomuraea sp. NPDC050663]|uniref:hypothetical protein n=1 Tax=Nonomuraea sp. NPDC050663 TaxID=3364370 RepID=UPI0037907994
MNGLLAGMGAITILSLTVGIVFIAKKVFPTFTAYLMLFVGFGLLGTFLHTVLTTLSRVHWSIPVIGLGVTLGIWIADVKGKNHVGRSTAIVAPFIPLFFVIFLVSAFGIDTRPVLDQVQATMSFRGL